MRRWSFFVYGVFCHLLFFVTFAYMAGFVGNLLVPKSIDSAPADGVGAVGFDLLLIALFGVAAFDHGTAMVQALLDAAGPATDRAQHLCPDFRRAHLLPDVAVARPRRRHLGCTGPGRARAAVGTVRRRLAAGPRRSV